MKKTSLGEFFIRNIREIVLIITIILISVLVQIRTEGVFLSSDNLSDLFR